jgi:hypothetical protein
MSQNPDIKINIDEVLELDYLVKDVNRDVVNISEDPSGSLEFGYISKETAVFDPPSSGTYKFDIQGQEYVIKVTEIPQTSLGTVEDFESGDISEYTKDVDNFSIISSPVQEGSYSLSGTDNGSGTPVRSTDSYIWSDNLDNVPSRGWEFAYDWYFVGGDDANSEAQAVIFCLQDSNSYYYAGSHNNNEMYIYKVKNGTIEKSERKSVNNYDPDSWYTGKVQIGSSSISFEDSVNSTSVSISDSEWNKGWFGFVVGENDPITSEVVFDDVRVTQQL